MLLGCMACLGGEVVPDPAARAAAGVDEHDDLNHMQAAALMALRDADGLAGVVLTASTDLPVGAGVSSSAALTLAVVAALGILASYCARQ